MKNKHQGLSNIAIFMVSIVLILAYGIYQSSQIKGSIQVPSPAVVPQITIPEPATLAYINFLNGKLADIASAKPSKKPVDLKLFGYSTHTETRINTFDQKVDDTNKDSQPVFSYRLTLCFTAQTGSFSIIDGQLYKEKATLPDGGNILKIESDRVSILKQGRTAWVYQQSSPADSKLKQPQTKNPERQDTEMQNKENQ